MGWCQVLAVVTLLCILQATQYECRAITDARSRVQRSVSPQLTLNRQRREAHEPGRPHPNRRYVPSKVTIKVPFYGPRHRITSIIIENTKPQTTKSADNGQKLSDGKTETGGDSVPTEISANGNPSNGGGDMPTEKSSTEPKLTPTETNILSNATNGTTAESDTIVDTVITTTQVETVVVAASNSEASTKLNNDNTTSTGKSSSSAAADLITVNDKITTTTETFVESKARAESNGSIANATAEAVQSETVTDQSTQTISGAGSSSIADDMSKTPIAVEAIADASDITLTDTSKSTIQTVILSETNAASQSASGNNEAQSAAEAKTFTDSQISTTDTETLTASEAAAEGNNASATAATGSSTAGGDASALASGTDAMAEAASISLSDTSRTNTEIESLSASQAFANGKNATASAAAGSLGDESLSSATASGTGAAAAAESETITDTTSTNSETESESDSEAAADGEADVSAAAESMGGGNMGESFEDSKANKSDTETESRSDSIADTSTSASGTKPELFSNAEAEGGSTSVNPESSAIDSQATLPESDSNISDTKEEGEVEMPTETDTTDDESGKVTSTGEASISDAEDIPPGDKETAPIVDVSDDGNDDK